MTTNAATESGALFRWDRDYRNHEQVRPYLDDFLNVYASITEAGRYPYNDSFKGRIEGVAGSADEDTAIYLLQNLRHLNLLDADIAVFLASGGQRFEDLNLDPTRIYRGTIVNYGFYVGGTGWRQYDRVRFQAHRRPSHRDAEGQLIVKYWNPRKRNSSLLTGGKLLVRLDGKP